MFKARIRWILEMTSNHFQKESERKLCPMGLIEHLMPTKHNQNNSWAANQREN